MSRRLALQLTAVADELSDMRGRGGTRMVVHPMTVTLPDAEWLQAQYRQACRAAADARGGRRGGRNTLDLHADLVGRVMERFASAEVTA